MLKVKGTELLQATSELVMDVGGPLSMPDWAQELAALSNEPELGPVVGDRGDAQLPDAARRLDLRRHQRDHEEHRLQGRAGAVDQQLIGELHARNQAPRLVPGIHATAALRPAVDGRAEPGHDGMGRIASMDFDLTEEQRLLRDSVDRLLADHYTFDKRKAYLAEPDGWSRGAVGAICRARAPRPAVRRGAWRVRRRRASR